MYQLVLVRLFSIHIMFCMFSTIRVIIVYIEIISTKHVLYYTNQHRQYLDLYSFYTLFIHYEYT